MSFKDVRSILDEVAQRRPGWKRRMGYSIIWESWEEIVGEEVSQNAFPERIVDSGVLMVRVMDSIWMQQLFLERYNILKKINRALSKGSKLKDIRFRLGEKEDLPHFLGPKRKDPSGHHLHPMGPMPLEKAPKVLLEEAEELTSHIKDDVLKERLMRAYIAFKLRKRRIGAI